MDWLRDLVSQKKETPVIGKRTSNSKRTAEEKRFHVRNSDKRILVAHKSPTGNGFVYKTKTDNGTRNVHINGNLYKTKEEAEKKVERLKKKEGKA
jgi:hypothetical protein